MRTVVSGKGRTDECDFIFHVLSVAQHHHGVGAKRQGASEFPKGVLLGSLRLDLLRFVDLGLAVIEGQDDSLDTGIIRGRLCSFGVGESVHGDHEVVHVNGNWNKTIHSGFLVVAANGCKRHKGEEIEFFEHNSRVLKGYTSGL